MPNSQKNLIPISIILLFFSFIFFTEFGIAAQIPKYDIQARIDPQKKFIQAHESVAFTNYTQRELAELYFYIYPNRQFTQKEKEFMAEFAGYFHVNFFPEGFQAPEFNISAVQENDAETAFTIEGEDQTLVRVPLKHPLKPGEIVTLKIDFTLRIPHSYGRLGWHQDITALSHWYPLLAVVDNQGWHKYPFYPFHRPFFSEASEYSVELAVPSNQVIIHSGFLVSEHKEDDWKTLKIESQLPIREFSLAMSSEYEVYEQKANGTLIRSFYLPGSEDRAKKAFQFARDLMNFYAQRFGPYPYEVFNIAPVYLGYGGEQMSNLIFLDTRVYRLPGFLDRYFDFLVAHETGHQWFYNVVGIDEYTQMWLEEGIHSYFIAEYLEEKYGPQADIIDFPEWGKDFEWLLPNLKFERTRDFRYKIMARTGFDHEVISDLSSFQEPSSIFSITYGKGSQITLMLKSILGEEVFKKVFERVFKEFQFRNLDAAHFIKICEEESRQDLSWFFDQWLYTKESLDVSIQGVENNKIILENKGKIRMPAKLKLSLSDGTVREMHWAGKEGKEELILEEKIAVKTAELDSGRELLDIDRTNNVWPRRVNLKFVPIYWNLYDLPVILPDDSYNLVAGPELANNGLGVKVSFQKPYDYNIYSATDYEFSESIHHSRLGFEVDNLFHSQTVFGFEMANQTDLDDGDEDLASGKVFLRRELWPAAYGLSDINDHLSFYLIRNQGLNHTLLLGGQENTSNISYLKRNEAIVGANFHMERSGTYPDPERGFKWDSLLEHSGHFLAATQYFNRASTDVSFYKPLGSKTYVCPLLQGTAALRLKYALGYPNDKNLFELGGIHGLRGFDRKEIRGAQAMLGSFEYRFPLKQNINKEFLDNIFAVESIGGVIFFDAGQGWYKDFDESTLRKDAGIGLRLSVSLGSFIEKIVVRADVAWPIHEEEGDGHFWFGVGQAF